MRLALLALATALTATGAATVTLGARPGAGSTAPADTTADARHLLAQQVIDGLGDRAALPADSVYQLKVIKGVTAAQFIRMMDLGWGRALGVNCTYCHVPRRYGREDSTQKEVTRQMVRMVGRINDELLTGIPNLKSPNPIVNCTTCHRGQVKPALDLDSAGSH